MYQEWHHLTFLHWSFDPAALRPLIPRPLELDTFDGHAWLGIVPFLIKKSRFRGIPWRIDFPETNVRTYVRLPNGDTGVWFFSLDAASLFATLGARMSFRLPYMWSRMQVEVSGNRIHYHSDRTWPAAPGHFECRVETGDEIVANEFDAFLLYRYRLYTKWTFGDVEHVPYPLRKVRLLDLRHDLFKTGGPPVVVHYSPMVDVRIGAPHFGRFAG